MASFSVGSWSFHEMFEAGQLNVFGYLESMKHRYHLNHADIWTGMFPSIEEQDVLTLRNVLRREDMTLACLATDVQLWHEDAGERAHRHQMVLRYLEVADTLRAKTLRIDIGSNTPHLTEAQFDYIADRYQQYARIAADRGFRVGPQTHQPAAQVPSNIERLVKAVNSPGFGVILDVDRWVEDESTGDERCAPYAMLVHFDSSRTKTREELEQKVRLLVSAGYNGVWSLEYRLGGSEFLGVACDLAELQRAVYTVTRG